MNNKIFLYFSKINKRVFLLVFVIFLFLRIVLGLAYGTQDMEWWKAWSTDCVQHGVTAIYGESDTTVVQKFKAGETLSVVANEARKTIYFTPIDYTRLEYKANQPPLYIYSLCAAGVLYSRVSPNMQNNRLFNFYINLVPTIASAIICFVIYLFIKSISTKNVAFLTALGYWLNPLVILNSPIQGYLDPLMALFCLLAVIGLYKNKIVPAYLFLTLGILIKPTAVIILPVVFWVGLREGTIKKNLIAWISCAATFLAVFSPYIIRGRFFSAIFSILSINEYSQDLSRQAMNLWWPVQYVWIAMKNSAVHIGNGIKTPWYTDIPPAVLSSDWA